MATRTVAPEVWRAIPGREGYEASNLGNIRSIRRRIWALTRHGTYTWVYRKQHLLKPQWGGAYLRVRLGAARQFEQVHLLVLATFVGPCPPGKLGLHWDDDKNNNALTNLRYGTYEDNCADCARNGHAYRGERHYLTKLTEKLVREIRMSTERGTVLAKRYQLSQDTICRIRKRKTWGWLSD